VKISFTEFGAVFDGKLAPDGMSIIGSLNQLSFVHPLTLSRVTPQTAWKIPKPQPPMASDADPGIVTATIKPSDPKVPAKGFNLKDGRLLTMNTTLSDLITFAYEVHPKQLIGAPAWIDVDKFDVTVKYSGEGEPGPSQVQSLVRKLLAESFDLRFHHGKNELPVYMLSKTHTGPKLAKSSAGPKQPPNMAFRDLGKLNIRNGSMLDLAAALQNAVVDRPVLDRTGITGRYDFALDWTPDKSQFQTWGATIPHSIDGPNQPPPLNAAIQQQLGLMLDATVASVDVIVIDHAEKPVNKNSLEARN
jgi:uncharacterized protein (TIGR03435 family)